MQRKRPYPLPEIILRPPVASSLQALSQKVKSPGGVQPAGPFLHIWPNRSNCFQGGCFAPPRAPKLGAFQNHPRDFNLLLAKMTAYGQRRHDCLIQGLWSDNMSSLLGKPNPQIQVLGEIKRIAVSSDTVIQRFSKERAAVVGRALDFAQMCC